MSILVCTRSCPLGWGRNRWSASSTVMPTRKTSQKRKRVIHFSYVVFSEKAKNGLILPMVAKGGKLGLSNAWSCEIIHSLD